MTFDDWRAEYPTLVRILEDRMRGKETCSDVIDSYDEVARSIWDFTARLLGDGGTRAVIARSIQLAATDTPLLQRVKALERKLDFGELREYTARLGCGAPEVLDALLRLGVMIFHTLHDLSDDAITGPLLSRLEENPLPSRASYGHVPSPSDTA